MENKDNKKSTKLGLKLGVNTANLAKDYVGLKNSNTFLQKPVLTQSHEASNLTDQELLKRFEVLKKATSVSSVEGMDSAKAREILKSNFQKEHPRDSDKHEEALVASSPVIVASSPVIQTQNHSKTVKKEAEDLEVASKPKLKQHPKEKFKKRLDLFEFESQEEFYKPKTKGSKNHVKQSANKTEKTIKEVEIYGNIRASELAAKMSEKVSDVIRALMNLGIVADANKMLDVDTAELVIESLGHKFKRVEAITVESILKNQVDESQDLKSRPPIITVMGHVDHGKTSLLDAIRSTDVASKEHGGITQSIGAYQITLPNGRKITLIDTPGHEAFTEMRSRGAQITDIVVLIVAADDGINHQTVEAINHIKAASLPIIVAVNKIDKVDDIEKSVSRIKNDLLQHNLIAEDMGGDAIFVPISALKRINLDKLEESILLLSDLLELRANYNTFASGIVLDAKIDKHRGIVASILVTRGTLRVGDSLVSGGCYCKVRAILTHKKESVKFIEPSTPATITGFENVPKAGDKFVVLENDKLARQVAEQYAHSKKEKEGDLLSKIKKTANLFTQEDTKDLAIIIKADSGGSIEAITSSLAKINLEKINLRILHSAVGSVNDSDVVLASASNATIFAFNTKETLGPMSSKLTVSIKHYSIIYDLIDDVTNLMQGLVEPTFVKKLIGQVNVRQIFEITKVGKVAGSYVTRGLVRRDAIGRVLRDKNLVYEGKIKTLKRFKDDVKEVKEGFECGLVFENYDDMQVGDDIEIYIEEKA